MPPTVDIRRILVPVDFSEAAPTLVRYAMEIVRGRGAAVRLFHVIEAPVSAHVPVRAGKRAGAAAGDVLELAEERLEALAAGIKGLRVDSHVAFGDPAKEILREAAEWNADVVVVATHGRSGIRRALLGSVAEEVVRGSRCPALVVPRRSVQE
jgi:nucleotide-binding universal stress UspA family protein